MLCQKCDKLVSDQSAYCPYCGNPLASGEQVQSPSAQKALAMIGDQRFFYLCIAYTVYAAISIIGGTVNVIGLLMTIFLWLVHTSAKKGDLNSEYMKYISGVLFAQFVAGIVAVVLIFLLIIVFAMMAAPPMGMLIDGMVTFDSGFVDQLTMELGGVPVLLPLLLALPVGAVMTVLVAVLAVTMVFALLSVKNYHKFAKSLYKHVKDPFVRVENSDGACKWLRISMVFQALSVLISMGTGVLPLISTAAYIAMLYFASTLIKENF